MPKEYQNEEIAMRIRQGEAALFSKLWEQNKPLLYAIGNKLYSKHQLRCAASGVDADDMKQACMLALWGAVNAYDPDKGFKLTAYYDRQFKRHFYEMLGFYKAKQPLDRADSLDAELPGTDDGFTLGDTIPDEYAAAEMATVEDRCYNEVLRERLDVAMNTLPARTRQIIQGRYYHGRTHEEMSHEYGISTVRAQQIERDGMAALRKYDRLHNGYLSVFLSDGFMILREPTEPEAALDKAQSAFERAEVLQAQNADLDYAEIVKRLLAI